MRCGATPRLELVDVLRNRNLLTLMLCNVMIMAGNKPELQGTVGRLAKIHWLYAATDCPLMPSLLSKGL